MSVFFFKRFLRNPRQVAYIVPSSKVLINRALSKFDFSEPRIIVEYGGGEGCIAREIVRRMHPSSTLLIFELDTVFVNHLRRQFRHDPRVHVIYDDAGELQGELAKRGFEHCDHIVSGVPFRTMDVEKKKVLLKKTYDALAPKQTSVFVTYQVTNELVQHATIFPRAESRYCLQNIPPMFIGAFYKQAQNKHNSHNGHAKKDRRELAHANGSNGNGRY